ncbi:MAG: YbaK/EbsC family protein [Pseudomonadota bacterium]
MSIARQIREFLDHHNLEYDTVIHEHTDSSQKTAQAAHLPGDKVAKGVLLKDDEGYLLAVVPANHRVHLGEMHKSLQRQVGLATEDEVASVFGDCDVGAIPPAGLLYDIDTVVDDALLEQPDVYFEAGDHEHLIHMSRKDFGRLLGDATHGRFSHHL